MEVATTELKNYNISTMLGKGAYSTVYRATYLDNRDYVLKKIQLKNINYEKQIEEVNILKTLSNDYVIKYKDSFIEDGYLYIAMEYADGGDLYSVNYYC
jgi:serine/threonine protein kinase